MERIARTLVTCPKLSAFTVVLTFRPVGMVEEILHLPAEIKSAVVFIQTEAFADRQVDDAASRARDDIAPGIAIFSRRDGECRRIEKPLRACARFPGK